mmetsp:Transcript_13412/g.29395  ORF Transcript_13412/g.29395 Transcript_13412/m.29395 type:complete len:203 (+) Transcript_13412:591-1199(+)
MPGAGQAEEAPYHRVHLVWLRDDIVVLHAHDVLLADRMHPPPQIHSVQICLVHVHTQRPGELVPGHERVTAHAEQGILHLSCNIWAEDTLIEETVHVVPLRCMGGRARSRDEQLRKGAVATVHPLFQGVHHDIHVFIVVDFKPRQPSEHEEGHVSLGGVANRVYVLCRRWEHRSSAKGGECIKGIIRSLLQQNRLPVRRSVE